MAMANLRLMFHYHYIIKLLYIAVISLSILCISTTASIPTKDIANLVLSQPALAEPLRFSSWKDAQSYVRKNFRGESIDTSRSSWIYGAEYFYANGEGFLIINMSGKDYIFRGVPESVWEGFRNAPSLGRYYNRYIKGRYYFQLN